MDGPGVEVEDGGVAIGLPLLGSVCDGGTRALPGKPCVRPVGTGAGGGASHGRWATLNEDSFSCHFCVISAKLANGDWKINKRVQH